MEGKDDELSYKTIGCAMKVHPTLGDGFQAATGLLVNSKNY